MKYIEKSGHPIHQAFQKFHKDNPHVYAYFKKFFFYLHDSKGWQQVSAKFIMERCRWEIITHTTAPDFKIDNNFTSRYVRLFLSDYPEYDKCFVLRELKS